MEYRLRGLLQLRMLAKLRLKPTRESGAARAQQICVRLGPDDVQRFFDRSSRRLPWPLTPQDRLAGFEHRLSVWHLEASQVRSERISGPACIRRTLGTAQPTPCSDDAFYAAPPLMCLSEPANRRNRSISRAASTRSSGYAESISILSCTLNARYQR